MPSTRRVPTTTLQRDGVGLCLSGGGYRAMLFHAGAFVRMNEAGLLGRLDRVSSVSGGSIAAGALGLAWSRLAWDGDVATNLDDLVTTPLIELAGHTIDVPSVLVGVWPGRIGRQAASRLRRLLFGDATLQALPKDGEGPRFVITATNLSNGTLWRFSRPYMRDYLTPEIARADGAAGRRGGGVGGVPTRAVAVHPPSPPVRRSRRRPPRARAGHAHRRRRLRQPRRRAGVEALRHRVRERWRRSLRGAGRRPGRTGCRAPSGC